MSADSKYGVAGGEQSCWALQATANLRLAQLGSGGGAAPPPAYANGNRGAQYGAVSNPYAPAFMPQQQAPYPSAAYLGAPPAFPPPQLQQHYTPPAQQQYAPPQEAYYAPPQVRLQLQKGMSGRSSRARF